MLLPGCACCCGGPLPFWKNFFFFFRPWPPCCCPWPGCWFWWPAAAGVPAPAVPAAVPAPAAPAAAASAPAPLWLDLFLRRRRRRRCPCDWPWLACRARPCFWLGLRRFCCHACTSWHFIVGCIALSRAATLRCAALPCLGPDPVQVRNRESCRAGDLAGSIAWRSAPPQCNMTLFARQPLAYFSPVRNLPVNFPGASWRPVAAPRRCPAHSGSWCLPPRLPASPRHAHADAPILVLVSPNEIRPATHMGFLRRPCSSREAFPIGETSPLLSLYFSSRANYPCLSSARALSPSGGRASAASWQIRYYSELHPAGKCPAVTDGSSPRAISLKPAGRSQKGRKAPLVSSGASGLNRGHWPPPYHSMNCGILVTAFGFPAGFSLGRFAFWRRSFPGAFLFIGPPTAGGPAHHWHPSYMQSSCRSALFHEFNHLQTSK